MTSGAEADIAAGEQALGQLDYDSAYKAFDKATKAPGVSKDDAKRLLGRPLLRVDTGSGRPPTDATLDANASDQVVVARRPPTVATDQERRALADVTQDRNDHRIAQDSPTLQALPSHGRRGGTPSRWSSSALRDVEPKSEHGQHQHQTTGDQDKGLGPSGRIADDDEEDEQHKAGEREAFERLGACHRTSRGLDDG